ncbi:MAG: acyl carrier protein [Oscillospiraceae bacterium]|nr:acyl carrier protein [Oscillospiraceae bacterium]MBQ4544625.1 acyl carrier protein [Oscillospiraceae bacterium]MBQ6902338.1 acyl carrier protein [Oscillospiraceae bacterium]
MVIDTLRNILEAQLDIDPATITEETNIIDDLGADSLDIVELMMTVEEEFDITIEDGDAHLFKTVGDVVNYIEANM